MTLNPLKSIILAFFVFTAPFSSAEGTTPVGTVTQIMFYEGHQGILIQHSNLMDPDSCGRIDWFILPDSYFRFKEAYAMLLAAKLTKARIAIAVSGCLQGIPQIKHIALVGD